MPLFWRKLLKFFSYSCKIIKYFLNKSNFMQKKHIFMQNVEDLPNFWYYLNGQMTIFVTNCVIFYRMDSLPFIIIHYSHIKT